MFCLSFSRLEEHGDTQSFLFSVAVPCPTAHPPNHHHQRQHPPAEAAHDDDPDQTLHLPSNHRLFSQNTQDAAVTCRDVVYNAGPPLGWQGERFGFSEEFDEKTLLALEEKGFTEVLAEFERVRGGGRGRGDARFELEVLEYGRVGLQLCFDSAMDGLEGDWVKRRISGFIVSSLGGTYFDFLGRI